MLSRMCEIAELWWTEGSNSLPGDKRTLGQRVPKEQFPSCPSRRNSPASSGLEQLTVTCLTWATAPGRPVLEPPQPLQLAATVSDSAPLHGTAFLPVCRHGLGPWTGSHWGLSGESCSHTTHSHRASLPEQDRSICKWRKRPPSSFQGHAVSQPSSPLLPRQAFQLSPPKSQFRERGKKCQVSCWTHKMKSTALE